MSEETLGNSLGRPLLQQNDEHTPALFLHFLFDKPALNLYMLSIFAIIDKGQIQTLTSFLSYILNNLIKKINASNSCMW